MPYSLTCSVTKLEGLSGVIQPVWSDSEGQEVMLQQETVSVGPVVRSGLVATVVLEFNPLRLSDEGEYTCTAFISSPALSEALTTNITEYIDVQICKYLALVN